MVAVGEPHYLAKESLANYTRIVATSDLFRFCPDTHHERDHILKESHLVARMGDKRTRIQDAQY